jgi:hypothetical protein
MRRASFCRLGIVPNGKRLLRADKGHTCLLRDGHVAQATRAILWGSAICEQIGQSPHATSWGWHCV